MNGERSTNQPSGDSSLSWQLMYMSFRLGKLHKTVDIVRSETAQILTILTAKPAAQMPMARRFGRIRDRAGKIVIHLRLGDIKKLYEKYREGPWGLLGLALWALGKWLGLWP